MSDGKSQPIKVQPRFQRAAAMMLQAVFGSKEEPTNANKYASVNMGHKRGSIMTQAEQQRKAKKRRNIRARSKMNKK